MKVVLDNNVLVSAFLWQKQLKPIYLAIKNNELIPYFTQETWQELQKILQYPKLQLQLQKITITAEETLRLIVSKAQFVDSPKVIPIIIKEDPTDSHILACAFSSQAKYIVSGDKHLLDLKNFQGISILTPRQFLNQLNKK